MAQKEANPSDKSEEETSLDDHQHLRAALIYKIIREEGEKELNRPRSALWWSGVISGVCVSMSIVSKGLLHLALPDSSWSTLIANLGYCVGFLIVILGRLQLFTENTITAVLPVVSTPARDKFLSMMRLWGIVLIANFVGTFTFALAATYSGIFSPEQMMALYEISHHIADQQPSTLLVRAIPAGFLIAAMVWMMPSSQGSEFIVIVTMTYLIALGGFAHIVVGSGEVFLLVLHGDLTAFDALFLVLAPVLAGNVIGGTALFSGLAYAQVKKEL